jgi:hypothetical protein
MDLHPGQCERTGELENSLSGVQAFAVDLHHYVVLIGDGDLVSRR